jgi:peptidoglycan/LPS O-acetylase OafA/YrhL
MRRISPFLLRFCAVRRPALTVLAILAALAGPASAPDLNSFRAQHKLPPLAVSAMLAGVAYAHAQGMASQRRGPG